MKRNDRLLALLLALQHGPVNAGAIAGKLEVSKRTILRDMQSLSEIGVPLYAVSGPGGGYRLMEGYRLPPLQFDANEALAALFALSAVARMDDTPFREARWTAMDKLRAALPERTLQAIEPALGRVELQVPQRDVKAPHLPALLEHAAAGRWLRGAYRSERHRRELELLPRKVYAAHGFWYCEAYSPAHGEVRSFRADRFERIEAIDAPAPTAGGADAAAVAAPRQDGKAGAGPEPSERIVARLTYRGALLAEQDYHVGGFVRQTTDDAWELVFDCPASEWDWAIRWFYGMGMDAEAIEPQRLRDAIGELAGQVSARYRRN